MESFLAVAPTDQEHELNTIRDPLRPIAVWELSDAHFDFDSSILLPSMAQELAELAVLVRAHPESPLSVWGHADPTGEIGYNKILSGRRAMALFALVTGRVELWKQLLDTPVGLDDWNKGARAARIMQGHLDGEAPPPGVPTRPLSALMPAYLAKLAVDGSGAPFRVPLARFLGEGADAGLKGAVQGCGESNPLLMISKLDAQRFAAPGNKAERDEVNAPNRRVTVMLFEKGTKVPPNRWPCPRVKEGIGGCRLRFWSDAKTRAEPTEARREFPADLSTFQCRFYDRLAMAARRGPALRPLLLKLFNEKEEPDPNVEFTLVAEDVTVTGRTDGEGMLRVRIPSTARQVILSVHDQQVPITITRLPSITTIAGVQVRLRNLGCFAGAADDRSSLPLEDAIETFLRELREEGRSVPVTRDARNPDLQALVLEAHGS